MALSKVVEVEAITVLSSGHVEVREVTKVMDDGKVIGKEYRRYVVEPGDEFGDKVKEVKDICSLTQTPEKVAAHRTRKADEDLSPFTNAIAAAEAANPE